MRVSEATECLPSVSSPTRLAHKVTLSQELRELAERFAERPVQLGEILDGTQGRGFDLLLVRIPLPFLTPIPLPGFSIPLGLVVALELPAQSSVLKMALRARPRGVN
jgi:hypothetical protein